MNDYGRLAIMPPAIFYNTSELVILVGLPLMKFATFSKAFPKHNS